MSLLLVLSLRRCRSYCTVTFIHQAISVTFALTFHNRLQIHRLKKSIHIVNLALAFANHPFFRRSTFLHHSCDALLQSFFALNALTSFTPLLTQYVTLFLLIVCTTIRFLVKQLLLLLHESVQRHQYVYRLLNPLRRGL